jgi:hypothetical protein
MSTLQRNRARWIPVDPSTATVLREEAKKVLEFNHDHFEDLRELSVEAQHALALRFQDAFDVITAVGWHPDPNDNNTTIDPPETIEVPLTDDHIEQLHQRRYDLAFTNRDRLEDLDPNEPIDPDLLTEITVDRLAAQALDQLFTRWSQPD